VTRLARICLLLSLVATAAVLAACGGGGSSDSSGAISGQPTAAGKSAGRDPTSPGGVVIRLWRFLKVGAVPPAILLYDPKVRQNVGLGTLAGVLAAQESTVGPLNVAIQDVQRTPVGTLVLANGQSSSGPAQAYSFLLQKKAGRWYVVYDTLVGKSIEALVAHQTDGSSTPDANLSARARRAGTVAARNFRSAWVSRAALGSAAGP
jgi:hypothetical protein